jgi:hypothetical protein
MMLWVCMLRLSVVWHVLLPVTIVLNKGVTMLGLGEWLVNNTLRLW